MDAEWLSERAVKFPHNPVGPLDSSRNHLVGSGTSLGTAEQIVSRVEMACHDNSGESFQFN
jgi:hypothetical protein